MFSFVFRCSLFIVLIFSHPSDHKRDLEKYSSYPFSSHLKALKTLQHFGLWPGVNLGNETQPVSGLFPSHITFGLEAKTHGSLVSKAPGAVREKERADDLKARVPQGAICLRAVVLNIFWVIN